MDKQITKEHIAFVEQHRRGMRRIYEETIRARDVCPDKEWARHIRSIDQVHREMMEVSDEAIIQILNEVEDSWEKADESGKEVEKRRQKMEEWLEEQCKRLEGWRKKLEEWREKAEEWWEKTEESREIPLSYQKWYTQSYIEAYQVHYQRRHQHRYHQSQPADSQPYTQAAQGSYAEVYTQANKQWYEQWFTQWYTRSFPLVSHRVYVRAYKDAYSQWYGQWFTQWCQKAKATSTGAPEASAVPAKYEHLEQGESVYSSNRQGPSTPPASVNGDTVLIQDDMERDAIVHQLSEGDLFGPLPPAQSSSATEIDYKIRIHIKIDDCTLLSKMV